MPSIEKTGKNERTADEKPAGTVLSGRIEHTLDPKKRLTIPAGWRYALGKPQYVFVMPDPFGKFLNIIPYEEMTSRLEKLEKKAFFDPKVAKSLRLLGENSEQLALDVQGRIRICDRFLKFAGLTGKLVMIGAMTRIQIWAPDELKPTEEIDQENFREAIAELDF